MKNIAILLTFLLSFTSYADESCSRVAIINYQEVLVDTNSSMKGEGLRYYLQKDEKATELLNQYQTLNRPNWKNAALSTTGSFMILYGLLAKSKNQGALLSKQSLTFGGATIIAMSYLINKTNSYNNEYMLLHAVDEYNKRNRPRIFFSPFADLRDSTGSIGLGIGATKDF